MLFQSRVWGMGSGDLAFGRSALHVDGRESLPRGAGILNSQSRSIMEFLPDMHRFHTSRDVLDVLEKFLVSSPSHTKCTAV